MKKRFYLFLISLLIGTAVSFPTTVFAQETKDPFEEVYKEYLVAQERYQRAHTSYVAAKGQYQNNQTLALRQKLQEATIDMLQERDEVVIKLLEALREKLRNPLGVEDADIITYQTELSGHIEWFKSHKERLSSASTLEDLVRDSNEAKARYVIAQKFVYRSFALLSAGKVKDFEIRLQDIYEQISGKLNIIRNDSREEYRFSEEKIQLLDRWLLEYENKFARGRDQYEKAIAKGKDVKLIAEPPTYYNQVIIDLNQAQSYFREASAYLKEVVGEIKIKE